MIFYWHASIVSNDIEVVLFNLARGKIPGTWITDIRFVYLLGVNKELSVAKFNPFALSSDHSF
jgi:hypothetical protein